MQVLNKWHNVLSPSYVASEWEFRASLLFQIRLLSKLGVPGQNLQWIDPCDPLLSIRVCCKVLPIATPQSRLVCACRGQLVSLAP